MTTDEIREKFLAFFARKDHKVVASSSLVPEDDPTVLFTSAGMSQFKDYFTGKRKNLRRAASCQKCFRTGDLDKVGKTPGHHTFFEMLGNFSFGDYFKEEAIAWAWEFLTGDLKLEEKNLWVSVYREDGEAYDIWREKIGVNPEKIIKLGDSENFWPANARENGPNGPCGPCSEIYYDRGEAAGCGREECRPDCDCGRFVEVWNLVFTQFDRRDGGVLDPLPQKNIDTGMGMERIAAVMQGAATNFGIDIFRPIVESFKQFIEKPVSEEELPAIHAVADHIRAVVFLIADGVLPANEGEGYVERMLIRRASGLGKEAGLEKPFLYRLVPSVTRVMKKAYPELVERRENISQIVKSEEERFQETLLQGTELLEQEIERLIERREEKISGEFAFRLYDTFGFPLSLTEEVARKHSLEVDRDEFDKELKIQRQRSRRGSRLAGEIFARTFENEVKSLGSVTEFVGYGSLTGEAVVEAVFRDSRREKSLARGEKGVIICRRTPFYGEFGGQVGDTGMMEKSSSSAAPAARARVSDTGKIAEVIVHYVTVTEGEFSDGETVQLEVDSGRRREIARHHTATHLLQAALRRVLGEHVVQSGSEVRPDGFRFDFTHFRSISPRELERVEDLVNQYILRDDPVRVGIMNLGEAKKAGALALFGEKYEQKVRVISVGDYSKELCGGTHVKAVGQIGFFRIVGESSVAAGTRRIEALAGEAACRAAKEDREKIRLLAETFKTSPALVVEQAEKITSELRQLNKKVRRLEERLWKSEVDNIAAAAVNLGEIKIVSRLIEKADIALLRSVVELLRRKFSDEKAVIVLGSRYGGKVHLVVQVSSDLSRELLSADEIIKELARRVDGGGGGRRDFAQAGGRSPDKLKPALAEAAGIVEKMLRK